MRKGRFKYSQMNFDQFQAIRDSINSSFLHSLGLYRQGRISAAELVAEYLFLIVREFRKKSYLGARRKNAKGLDVATEAPLHRVVSGDLADLQFTALQIFHLFQIRGIPEAVNVALVAWHAGHYDLELLVEKPSPEQVLLWQCEKRRVVTVFANDQGIQNHFDENRDPFSFTLHDLVHAYRFFGAGDEFPKQVEFFNHINLWLRKPEVQRALRRDVKLAEAVDYVCSDMNSHSAHMWSYFHHMNKVFMIDDRHNSNASIFA